MIDLGALIAEADALIEEVEPELVAVRMGKRALGVRFVPMAPAGWRELTLKHPPRSDVLQDQNVGYNTDAVVAAFPNVALVDGDEVDDMIRPGEDGEPVSKWPSIFSRLTSQSQKDVVRSIWFAHDRGPDLMVRDAGKASKG